VAVKSPAVSMLVARTRRLGTGPGYARPQTIAVAAARTILLPACLAGLAWRRAVRGSGRSHRLMKLMCVERPEPNHPALVHEDDPLGVADSVDRIGRVRGDLEQRDHGERTLRQARMGHRELRAGQNEPARPEQVQIERARPPALATHASVVDLHSVQALEQTERTVSGGEPYCRVEKRGLGRSADRDRLVQTRQGYHAAEPGERCHCCTQVCAPIAQVGPEADDSIQVDRTARGQEAATVSHCVVHCPPNAVGWTA
jgi:hypothetical protein